MVQHAEEKKGVGAATATAKTSKVASPASASPTSKPPSAAAAKTTSSRATPTASPAKKPAATASSSPSPAANKSVAGTVKKGAAVPAAQPAAPAVPQLSEEEAARLKAEGDAARAESLAKAQAEMEELRKKAWLMQVEFDRKEEAKRRKKAEDETKRRKEAKLTKEMLEAAFDGEDGDLEKLLEKRARDVPHGSFVLSIPVARGANWFLAGGGRRMDEEEATAAAAERIAAAAEDGTSLPVRLATDVVRFLYGGTGRREPADGGVVSASLLNAKPAVGGIGVEPRGGGVLRVLFTVASDAVADTVVRWRHELRRCVDSTAVFDVLSDREEAQHQALWPAFLAAKVAGKRAQFHRARLVVDGERAKALGMRAYCDAADTHGNTLLSEAAAGGGAAVVSMLLARGADPNTRGEFARTPLWRACFLGKSDVIGPLLQGGADPRMGNEQGELPVHVASGAAIKELLGSWDVAQTDRLVPAWQARREAESEAEAAQLHAAVRGAEGEVAAAKTEFDNAKAALKHARLELEKRIFEHDVCVGETKSDELVKVTLEQIHAAETTVEEARSRAHASSHRFDGARLALRESTAAKSVAGRDGGVGDEAGALPGVPVDIKELDDVLVRDVGDRIQSDGRWPLVIDPSGQASVFLRYLDTNYVNALSRHNMEPNCLRRSILGGIRYGKPVVLDQMDVDLWDELPRMFDAVHPGLLDALLTKRLLKDEGWKVLISQEDGEQYELNQFQDARVSAFKFVLLTSSVQPNEAMVAATYALRVDVKG
ncbi:hypothetical protein FOA52_009632 [Chlamydomonas sp. UWO 241]|nr:hypothetical protein FOA52_009632 [Chlamydomonas sp. UWO 241]